MQSPFESKVADISSLSALRAAIRGATRGENERSSRSLLPQLQAANAAAEKAALLNNLAALTAADGHVLAAEKTWRRALQLDPQNSVVHRNLKTLVESGASDHSIRLNREIRNQAIAKNSSEDKRSKCATRLRIAIVSLLFNWPSTGGGTVHTKELTESLQQVGYEVTHIYAVFPAWGVGNVTETLSVPHVALEFHEFDWTLETIQDRFRDAVNEFAPDAVIICDSWNSKVILAEAVADYPYFLRLAALECICPLNNVRLLFENNCLVQCLRNQLAEPDVCRQCVRDNERYSGGLHQVERDLVRFGDAKYSERLRRAFEGAEAVLAVNPTIAELVQPFCRRVEVVPSGFDPTRFPAIDSDKVRSADVTKFIFAGLVDEPMKGFSVLFDACRLLWSRRQDFELVVTAERSPDRDAPFIRWIGWQSQSELPVAIRAADILIFPTIAQEALGRTAVEAMGCGKPVIASRLGGLAWVVEENMTGLLATPGDPCDLAGKMKQLMDEPALATRMGQAGREKFERDFPWPVIVERHYRPLLKHLIA